MRKQNWAPESSGSFVQVSSKSVASFVLLWRQQAPLLLQVLTGLSVARFLHAHQKQHSLREYAIPGNAVTGPAPKSWCCGPHGHLKTDT